MLTSSFTEMAMTEDPKQVCVYFYSFLIVMNSVFRCSAVNSYMLLSDVPGLSAFLLLAGI